MSAPPPLFFLPFRDLGKTHGGVQKGELIAFDTIGTGFSQDPEKLRRLRRAATEGEKRSFAGKHVCFLLHGFNVDGGNGVADLGALAAELTRGGPLRTAVPPVGPLNCFVDGVDVVISVLWPGDWYSEVNYPFLLGPIRETADWFVKFLSECAFGRASFVTHSMGVRVVLETIQKAIARRARAMPAFETALFTAPAASDDILDSPFYSLAVAALSRIVIVSSVKDTVLSGAFPIGNRVEQALWPNDIGSMSALGLRGPRLKPNSPARAKLEWYAIPGKEDAVVKTDDKYGFDHKDYLPAPLVSVAAPFVDGWSNRRTNMAKLIQTLLDREQPAWPKHVTNIPTAS